MRSPKPAGLVFCVLGAPLVAQTYPPIRYLEPGFAAVQRTNDLVYGQNFNPWFSRIDVLQLDVHEPHGDSAPLRPALVYAHGGQWMYGDKSDGGPVLVMTELALRGVVGFSINYRLANTTSAGPPGAQIVAEDMKAAVRWVRKNAQQWRIDPDRIGVGGDSVGANAAIVTGYTSWAGTSGNPGFPSNASWVLDLWGRGVTAISDPNVPLFIVHGTLDAANSYTGEALRMQAEAAANGVPCELVTLTGADHAPWGLWNTFGPPLLERQWEWQRLVELGGLDAVPGWSSPGTFAPAAIGWDGDVCALFLATTKVEIPIPYLGTLWLDPSGLVPLWTTTFPQSPRVSRSGVAFPVPAGYQGTLHLQGIYLRTAGLPRLSNCFSASF